VAAVFVTGRHLWREPEHAKPAFFAIAIALAGWHVTNQLHRAIDAPTLPQEALPLLAGGTIDLSERDGRPLVVNLWATWCPPCVREMPMMAEVAAGQDAVDVVFANQGEGPDRIRRFFELLALEPEPAVAPRPGQPARSRGGVFRSGRAGDGQPGRRRHDRRILRLRVPLLQDEPPALLDLVERDDGVRLLMRDWPIFGSASIRATQLVLGAAELGAYEPAHLALMATERRLRLEDVDAVLTEAGIDVAAAGAAFNDAHARWSGFLTRNAGQAEAFGPPGTPGFVIGSAIHRGALSEAQLAAAVAAARG
jgi:thiol-disulfide isomerase/thioredoxin